MICCVPPGGLGVADARHPDLPCGTQHGEGGGWTASLFHWKETEAREWDCLFCNSLVELGFPYRATYSPDTCNLVAFGTHGIL